MPSIPLAPANTAALHDATRAWFHELPLTRERVATRLRDEGVVVGGVD